MVGEAEAFFRYELNDKELRLNQQTDRDTAERERLQSSDN